MAKHYVFVGSKSCTIEKCYLFSTCTDFAQTLLILKVWKHLFQIHFNIGGTRPPGVRNRPRSLQNEALETAIEIPLYLHRFFSNMAHFKGMHVLTSDAF